MEVSRDPTPSHLMGQQVLGVKVRQLVGVDARDAVPEGVVLPGGNW
jgi:hypothetical protein